MPHVMDAAVITLLVAVGGLWVDAMRHVVLGWRAFVGWQLSLPRDQRRPARAVLDPRLRSIDYIPRGGMQDALPERTLAYRHHARWFLAEAALFTMIIFVVVYWPN